MGRQYDKLEREFAKKERYLKRNDDKMRENQALFDQLTQTQVRLKIIRNARIKHVGKSEPCMVCRPHAAESGRRSAMHCRCRCRMLG